MTGFMIFNWIISILITLCYAYQFVYVFVGLLKKTIDLNSITKNNLKMKGENKKWQTQNMMENI